MDTENKPEKRTTIPEIIGPILLRLADRFLIPPPVSTNIGNTLSSDRQDDLVKAYMEAFKSWGDPSYKLSPEKTLMQKRTYLEREAFQPDVLITTMGEGKRTCAFAITGVKPNNSADIAANFASGITHIYPELSQMSTLLKSYTEDILPETAIPFNDLAIIREELITYIPPYVPRPVERLLRAHMSTRFLELHLQELRTLGNDTSTPLVFWTAHISPLSQIARQRPDSFTQMALFTPKSTKVSQNNPEISIFKTTIGQLLTILQNPFTYRRAISSEIQVPLFTYQYESI